MARVLKGSHSFTCTPIGMNHIYCPLVTRCTIYPDAGLWSQSRRLGLETISRRTNVSSRSRREKNCQRLGLELLRLVPIPALTYLDMTQTGALQHRRCCQPSTCTSTSISVEKLRSTLLDSSSAEGQRLIWNIRTYLGDTSASPLFDSVCSDISACHNIRIAAIVSHSYGRDKHSNGEIN